MSGTELEDKEQAAASGSAGGTDDESPRLNDQVGKGYTKDSKSSGSNLGAKLKKRKGVIGGILGAGASGLILLTIISAPLKLEHIVNNLQERFFGTSESAVSKQTDNLVNN